MHQCPHCGDPCNCVNDLCECSEAIKAGDHARLFRLPSDREVAEAKAKYREWIAVIDEIQESEQELSGWSAEKLNQLRDYFREVLAEPEVQP